MYLAYWTDIKKKGKAARVIWQQRKREEILTAYEQQGRDWNKVAIYYDDPEHILIWLTILEEQSGEKINSKEDLQRVASLTIDSEETETLYTRAREHQYTEALEAIILKGGKYADLLKITPDQYGLPETWKGFLDKEGANQETTIKWALIFALPINDDNKHYLSPVTARELADLIDAPLDVILKASDTVNHRAPH